MEYRYPVENSADVIVCGAGLSGCLAAIGAARTGASVILLERAGMLGGVAMTSMMNSMTNMFFNDINVQLIRGAAGEIMDEAVNRGVLSAEWKQHEYREIYYNLEGLHQILLDKLWADGVKIYTHVWATDAILDGDTVVGVEAQTRAGHRTFLAKAVVDATGDQDVVNSCGEDACTAEKTGSSTLLFELIGVDVQRLFEYFQKHPDNYDENKSERLDFAAFERNWLEKGMFYLQHGGGVAVKPLQDAIARGEFARESGLAVNCDALAIFATRENERVLINSNFFEFDEFNRLDDFSYAELSARAICLSLLKTLKNVLPGFENAELTHIGSELGCRKTRYLNGRDKLLKIKYEQYYDDVIGVAPVIDFTAANGCFGPGSIDLPAGVLIPRKIDNLLTGSAKCISATWEARHYMRLQPVCMLVGQSAGVIAGLSAQTGVSTQNLDIKDIQRALLKQGVYLGDEQRLKALHLCDA